MGLGKNYRSGRSSRSLGAAELMKNLSDGRQARRRTDRQAQFAQGINAAQQARRAFAVVQFGDEV